MIYYKCSICGDIFGGWMSRCPSCRSDDLKEISKEEYFNKLVQEDHESKKEEGKSSSLL